MDSARKVKNLQKTVFAVAVWMQNHPDKFVEAIKKEAPVLKELNRLVTDLYSLCEVIITEENV